MKVVNDTKTSATILKTINAMVDLVLHGVQLRNSKIYYEMQAPSDITKTALNIICKRYIYVKMEILLLLLLQIRTKTVT